LIGSTACGAAATCGTETVSCAGILSPLPCIAMKVEAASAAAPNASGPSGTLPARWPRPPERFGADWPSGCSMLLFRGGLQRLSR